MTHPLSEDTRSVLLALLDSGALDDELSVASLAELRTFVETDPTVAVNSPHVHKYLDLSTAHLPPAAAAPDWLSGQDGIVVSPTTYGWWLWVHSIDDELGPVDPAVVAIWRRARDLGCDWVLLDRDGPTDDTLPVWSW
jgi:hypothetical protein